LDNQKERIANEYNKCAKEVNELYNKLNLAYDKEGILINDMKVLKHKYDQLLEDKEVLQMMYMHHSNKLNRIKNLLDQC